MGGVAKAVKETVKSVGEAVGAVVEGAGKVVSGVVDDVKDAGKWLDENVLQPMLDNPIKTIATVAAVATGQAQLIPYINAADAVAKGGDIGDVAKSFAVSYAAGAAGSKVGSTIGEATGSQIVGDIAGGAARGATGAGLSGGDIGQGALLGGVTAGVGSAVREVFSPAQTAGTNIELAGPTDPEMFLYETPPELGQTGSPYLGSGLTAAGIGSETLSPFAGGQTGVTPQAPAPTTDFSRPIDYGLVAPTTGYTEQLRSGTATIGPTPTTGDDAYSLVPEKPTTESGIPDYGIDSNQIALLPDNMTDPNYDWEAVGKWALKETTNALGRSLLQGIAGPQYLTLMQSGGPYTGPLPEGGGPTGAEAAVNVAEIKPSKYEMKNFIGPAGERTTIPFKDDKPQIPIPAGYTEEATQGLPLETMQAAKGGLAAKKKKKPTSSKGLAAKKK